MSRALDHDEGVPPVTRARIEATIEARAHHRLVVERAREPDVEPTRHELPAHLVVHHTTAHPGAIAAVGPDPP